MSPSRVEVDPGVLVALETELGRTATRVDALLARAQGLQAGGVMGRFAGSSDWARGQRPDLLARVQLLRETDDLGLGTLGRYGLTPLDLAASDGPLSERLQVIAALAQAQSLRTGPVDWSRKPHESLDDWSQRAMGEAIELVAGHGVGAPLAEAYEWYSTYQGLLVSMAATSMAASRFAAAGAAPAVLRALSSEVVAAQLPATFVEYLAARVSALQTFTAPGTSPSYRAGQLIRVAGSLEDPVVAQQRLAAAARVLRDRGLGGLATRLESLTGTLAAPGPLLGNASTLARWTGTVFGRAWQAPLAPGALGPLEAPIARGATNLIAVRRASGLSTTLRVAGGVRVLGVAGSVAATGYDVAEIVSQGDPREAFRRDGAGYVADWAKLGFDASLTAALLCPNPVTWGAVGVTGVVWAGAELVDHWDDVSAAVGDASDWTADRLEDGAGIVADAGRVTLDAVGDVGGYAVDKVSDAGGAVLDAGGGALSALEGAAPWHWGD